MTTYPLLYPSTYGDPWPQSPLDVRTELLLGQWTDVSTFVMQREGTAPPVTITRGRPDESSSVNPSAMTAQFNNRDGRFSVKNPLGPYFGQLSRNTPVRLSVPAQTSYLRFETDNASYVNTPSSSALNVAGDLELQIDARTAFSALGQSIPMMKKWAGSPQLSWLTEQRSDGRLNFWRSLNGSTAGVVTSTLPLPAGRVAVKVTYASASGTVTWYTAPTISGTWTQLGATQSFASGGALFASTSPPQIGDPADPGLTGSVYAAKILSGIGGTVVASPDFTTASPGASSLTDAQGNVWTLSGTAEFSNRSYRYHGEMASLPVGWDVTGTDVYVPVTAGGILRRLGQGAAALQSPMRRATIAQTGTLAPVQYWTCEDLAGATALGSATGGPLMTINGPVQMASDSSFVCSNSLPRVNGSSWFGPVPHYTSNGSIVVRFLMNMSTAPASGAVIMRLVTSGTAREVQLYAGVTAGALGLKGLSASGTTVFDTGGGFVFPVNGAPAWVSIELQPSGGNVQYSVVTLLPGASTGNTTGSPTFAGSVGNINAVVVAPNQDSTQVTIGHITVQSAWQSLFNLAKPLNAWQGEAAGDRFLRLCSENGIAARVVGPPDTTIAMGAQSITTLTSLLQEIEEADRGQLYEPRRSYGLGYRTQASMLGQSPAVTLNYSQAQLGADGSTTVEPKYDDLYTRNDMVVTRSSTQTSGATYQYTLNDGSAMSISPPPIGVGDYSNSVSVNVQLDTQLPDQAGWRVHIGTVDEARWPQVPVNMARAAAAAVYFSVLEADIGDYFAIVNPPGQLPPDQIRQLLWHTQEQLGGFFFRLEWAGVPESPYETAILDDLVYGHGDTDGASLAAGVSSSGTSLSVATTGPSGIVWTQTAADFPFDIKVSGERMTVTNITGASSPQTFTVTRSVNGVVKAQSAGADVRLWFAPSLAMV